MRCLQSGAGSFWLQPVSGGVRILNRLSQSLIRSSRLWARICLLSRSCRWSVTPTMICSQYEPRSVVSSHRGHPVFPWDGLAGGEETAMKARLVELYGGPFDGALVTTSLPTLRMPEMLAEVHPSQAQKNADDIIAVY